MWKILRFKFENKKNVENSRQNVLYVTSGQEMDLTDSLAPRIIFRVKQYQNITNKLNAKL